MHSDHENRRGRSRREAHDSERNYGRNGENGRRESNLGRDFDGDRDRGWRTGDEWREGRYGGSEEERSTYRPHGSEGTYESPGYLSA